MSILFAQLVVVFIMDCLGMLVLYPMMFLSGAFFSLDILPAGVHKVADFLPLTFVVNLLSGLWYGEPWGDHLLDVGVLTGILILGVAVSVRAFRWE